ncbi:hypothetical protein, partial [Nocardiopsis tropica]|uniref:hypothetical protein n=1 Tax=Nocardiopsis tropica TaxID=109330 RepID=UPI0031CE019D
MAIRKGTGQFLSAGRRLRPAARHPPARAAFTPDRRPERAQGASAAAPLPGVAGAAATDTGALVHEGGGRHHQSAP